MNRCKVLIVCLAMTSVSLPGQVAAQNCSSHSRPVDLAICLDQSGSMENLIDSVRGRIWDIVTDLSRATPMPQLRVALLSFGGEEAASDGYIVRHTDFTDDLDLVYAKLMALEAKGGEEYVGWALETAVETLSWSDDLDGLRVIFIAGNESADQKVEAHDFRKAASAASERNILINSVYAGNAETGVVEKWNEIALFGKGTYNAIDVARGTIQIDTPHDSELVDLNRELNGTYIPYGKKGKEGLANQIAQDNNASKMGAQSCGSRVAAKGCALYNVASWDLVDAVAQPDFQLESLETLDLPVFMQTMTVDQRKAYVSGMQQVRESIKRTIADVDKKRQSFIRAERAKRGERQCSLDDAMLTSLREQATAKGFSFPKVAEKPAAPVPPMIEGPQLPTVELGLPVRANVAGLMRSLPALEYAVGTYRSQRRPLADILARQTNSTVRIALGDQNFASSDKANTILVELLEGAASELSTIRIVNAAPKPFVYAPEFASSNPATGVTTCYRIGGIEFEDRAMAERVRDDIHKALKTFEQRHASQSAKRGPATLVSSKLKESPKQDDTVTFYRDKIKMIAETAGGSYTTLTSGC
ncbi:MAG: vWA domain-containing protein [Phycisphaerae bacterium]